ncbi:MAG TPA: DUF3043 domain-containing protein [Mycobacteriales bacterium]|nr:DUF3043 domain-containing protein [Mycobacteriales bacterium]
MPETKGRPTPKRSAARAARRQPVVQPRAGAGRRPASGSSARVSMREAMRTGDERNYPPMAAGPERALVRDVVDARRSFAWTALPLWVLGVAVSLVPTVPTRFFGSVILLPLVVGVIVLDSMAAGRAVGAALDERWPDGTKDRRRSLLWYGVARNTQFRRQRLPRPRVWRGKPVEPAA